MSKQVKLCLGCGQRGFVYRFAGGWLCDGCIGTRMRAAAGIKQCKGCKRTVEVDEFGDCSHCRPIDDQARAMPPKKRARKAVQT